MIDLWQMGAVGMLGKLSWPAHDQIRGVDGSELGDLSAGILEGW
jgi:hypothetical protein